VGGGGEFFLVLLGAVFKWRRGFFGLREGGLFQLVVSGFGEVLFFLLGGVEGCVTGVIFWVSCWGGVFFFCIGLVWKCFVVNWGFSLFGRLFLLLVFSFFFWVLGVSEGCLLCLGFCGGWHGVGF